MSTKKSDFTNPQIEEQNMDPVSKLLMEQTFKKLAENKKMAKKAVEAKTKLVLGDLTIDKIEHKAYFAGTDLNLANREYEVLIYLANHLNEEVTFEDLGIALFGSYMDADRSSIMVNVSRLRKKMQIDVHLENMLENIRGKGYRLIYINH